MDITAYAYSVRNDSAQKANIIRVLLNKNANIHIKTKNGLNPRIFSIILMTMTIIINHHQIREEELIIPKL